MRHYLKITRPTHRRCTDKTRTKGCGSDAKLGVIFDIEVLTQHSRISHETRRTMGRLKLVEHKNGRRELMYFGPGVTDVEGRLTFPPGISLHDDMDSLHLSRQERDAASIL